MFYQENKLGINLLGENTLVYILPEKKIAEHFFTGKISRMLKLAEPSFKRKNWLDFFTRKNLLVVF